jgi:hypothetical protein
MLSPQASHRLRPSIQISSFPSSPEPYTDARLHGYQGQTRTVRLPGAAPTGGGAIAKSEDGMRCVVAGKECVFFGNSVRTVFSQTHRLAHIASFRHANFTQSGP